MNKIIWPIILVLAVGLAVTVSALFFKGFGEKLYDTVAEQGHVGFGFVEDAEPNLVAIDDVHAYVFSSIEKTVELQSESTPMGQPLAYRQITIRIAQDAESEVTDSSVTVRAEHLRFRLQAEDLFRQITERVQTIIEELLEDKQIQHDPGLFAIIHRRLADKTDEALFLESISINPQEIKSAPPVEAIYQTALHLTYWMDLGHEDIRVLRIGAKHLYLFVDESASPKISMFWRLYDGEAHVSEGILVFLERNNTLPQSFDEALGYLKTILKLDDNSSNS